METKKENKNRFTISMSDSVYEYLEEIRTEKGLTKSAMLTLVLEEYKKGQKNA
ncbi:CopG family transcriptional regulator [Macrococcus brunensis]|uniref:CopG family transcriptional regulator n=1 Tax=Macrococcus brunensis TaxID=198483 RepID=UPI001EF0CA3C|nr:CopG family transcriptional regulator [Macrococcus brunensis]ULG75316.1 CopG family transcriptional regulator [Macrococcus brunensis]